MLHVHPALQIFLICKGKSNSKGNLFAEVTPLVKTFSQVHHTDHIFK
jgi:hypothetical protein